MMMEMEKEKEAVEEEKKSLEERMLKKKSRRRRGDEGRRSAFPGLSPEFVFCFSQLVCQQEALGSSWIRPSVRDLAADPENETPPSHTHTEPGITAVVHLL